MWSKDRLEYWVLNLIAKNDTIEVEFVYVPYIFLSSVIQVISENRNYFQSSWI